MPEKKQTYANHIRLLPLFHFFAFPVLVANFLVAAWRLVQTPSFSTFWAALIAVALASAVLAARVMALTVQDRVIRLEMRLRLQVVLPPDLRARIQELTRRQLVGLRFASDGELPDLVRQVLGGSLKGGSDIKKAIRDWQADYLRA